MCTSRLTSPMSAISPPGVATFGRIWLEILTCQIRAQAEWFNTAAFAPPAPFTFGNSGRNSLRANWFKNLDLSLFKDFPFNEKRSLQFRAEAFNVTNTPTWGIPVNDLNNPAKLGSINSTRSTERQLQLSLKLYF